MKTIQGDLLNAFADGNQAIMHQANCQKVMNSGVAKVIREKWPRVYQADLEFLGPPEYRLGKSSLAIVDKGYIFNLYGQLEYSNRTIRNTNYEAFYTGLESIRNLMIKMNIDKIAAPYGMGSCLGGADWSVISAMIDSVFNAESGIEVTAYNINRKA